MEQNNLSVALSDSPKEETVSCIGELTEVGLDAVMDEGLLKDIPFVSTAISLYRIGRSFAERHYVKKLCSFLNAINNSIVDENERQAYITKIKDNAKFRNQELEYLLVLIDRYISYDKPKMLAKLYLAYLKGIVVWEELTMYAEVIDRFLLLDYNQLISTSDKVIVHRNIGGEAVLRLVALGLMTEITNMTPFKEDGNGGIGITYGALQSFNTRDKIYKLTEFGSKLAKILNPS